MKKVFSLVLGLIFVFVLVGCNQEVSENVEPTFSGVQAEHIIDLGQTFDALDGVSANDEEDGDITSSIIVTTLPDLTVTGGEMTPDNVGDYYITYSVTDSSGATVEAYSTLKVMPVVGEKVEFYDVEFVEGEAEYNGFDVLFESPASGSHQADKSVLTINVDDNGDADWHAKLVKSNMTITKGNAYEFVIKMKASETVKMHYIINNAEAGWAPYTGTWNMEVGTEFTEYTLEFLANEDSQAAEFLLQFGGDNFDGFTNPNAFDIMVDSIKVYETPSVISETLHTDDFSTTDAGVFEVSVGETAVGTSAIADGVLTVDLTANGDADWHAKIFKNNIAIEAGASYVFTVNMKASQTVKMHYIINNAEAGWSPFVGQWNMEVGTEYANYTLEFIANENSANAEFLVQFGGDNFDGFTNPEAWSLMVESITITKNIAVTTETAVVEDDFEDGNTEGWASRGDETYSATISNVDNKLNFQIDAYPAGNNPWEMDLYLVTDFDLIEGNTYKLSFDYETLNDQFYELCFEDVNLDWQIRAGFKNGTLTGSGTLEYTFVASMNITDLYIKLSLGNGADGVTTNTLKLDNVVLSEIIGSTESNEDFTEFEPSAETTAWGTFNNEAEGAEGVVYVENGKLIYEITAFGATDWYNKLFLEDIDFTAGGLYTIEFTVKADKATEAIFFLNPTGQWDPRISESLNITTSDQTFSFTMDDKLLFDMNFEILFQFGFSSNEAPTTIEFTNITIYRQE